MQTRMSLPVTVRMWDTWERLCGHSIYSNAIGAYLAVPTII